MALKNGFYISLDFELFWGFDMDCELSDPQKKKFKNTKLLVPKVLQLFEKQDIACTWAIVGALLNESKEELLSNIPESKPSYNNIKARNFEKMEQIARDFPNNTWCFSSELAHLIKQTSRQEIGTHTYSHYYCLEEGQRIEMFLADIEIAKRITFSKLNIYPQSIVYPRNQVNYLDYLPQCGIKIYRGAQEHWAYCEGAHTISTTLSKRLFRFLDRYLPLTSHIYDIHSVNGNSNSNSTTINVPQSRLLVGYNNRISMLESFRIRRIKAEMTNAAKQRLSYHLWWHPHNFADFPEKNLEILNEILQHYKVLNKKYNFKSYNLIEAVE